MEEKGGLSEENVAKIVRASKQLGPVVQIRPGKEGAAVKFGDGTTLVYDIRRPARMPVLLLKAGLRFFPKKGESDESKGGR